VEALIRSVSNASNLLTGLRDGWDLSLLHVLASNLGSLVCRSLGALLIGREIEGNKEEEVGAESCASSESGKFLSGAGTNVRQPWSIGAGVVIPGGEVNEAKADNELGDLEAGDPLLPPNLDATSALEIVPVHHDVHEEVESDRDP